MKKKIIIIGGGIGGLGTAALLGMRGHNVTLIEKNAQLGGRARQYRAKGFTFDMGPSWYMMPDVFEYYFKEFDKKPEDFYKLIRLDPKYTVSFGSGNRYVIPDSISKTKKLFESIEPGSGATFDRVLADSKKLYNLGIPDLSLLSYSKLADILAPRVLSAVPQMRLFESFHSYLTKRFSHDEIIKILEFTSVFLGGAPHMTPAFYSLVTHADFGLGIYHPIGGMYEIVNALATLCREYGVRIKTHESVTSISVPDGQARGVVTDKKTYDADIVVANADYHFTETKLLEKKWQTIPEQEWKKKVLSPSAFLIYLGVSGRIKNLSHHYLYFSAQWDTHFDTVFSQKKWPQDPSYYVHCPTKTDPSLAPDGDETIMMLVPIAPGLSDTPARRKKFSEKIISHFEHQIGESLRDRIRVKKIFSTSDFVKDYNAYQGAAFGLAHTLSQTAFMRPLHHSKKVDNLYYVGQYTNPGVGVPTCLLSALIVSKLISNND